MSVFLRRRRWCCGSSDDQARGRWARSRMLGPWLPNMAACAWLSTGAASAVPSTISGETLLLRLAVCASASMFAVNWDGRRAGYALNEACLSSASPVGPCSSKLLSLVIDAADFREGRRGGRAGEGLEFAPRSGVASLSALRLRSADLRTTPLITLPVRSRHPVSPGLTGSAVSRTMTLKASEIWLSATVTPELVAELVEAVPHEARRFSRVGGSTLPLPGFLIKLLRCCACEPRLARPHTLGAAGSGCLPLRAAHRSCR